jgi:hypothetical protein
MPTCGIRRLPNKESAKTPYLESVCTFYNNETGRIESFDEFRNEVPFYSGSNSVGVSMLLPRLEELGTVIVTGGNSASSQDIDIWIDRNNYFGDITINYINFSNSDVSELLEQVIPNGYSNGTSGATGGIQWADTGLGDSTFDIQFSGTGLTTFTRQAILRLS